MAKITKLDRASVKALREPIEAELKALGERLGLTFQLGNGTYGSGAEASFKLILKVDDPEVKAAAAREEWDRYCGRIGIDWNRPNETGLRPEDFGTEFVVKGVRYRTAGIATRGRGSQKYPVIVDVLSGPRAGQQLMFGEAVVPVVRAATDAIAKVA